MARIDSLASMHRARPGPPSFFGLGRAGLAELMSEAGEPGYRAEQLLTWVYRRGVRDPQAMSDLPADLRGRLPELCGLELPAVESRLQDRTGDTLKFVVRLNDGERVECVSMRTGRRRTLRLSSQVGC